MALQLRSTVTQNQAGTELYIEVVEATGVYHADDNPGGFGTPNPARNLLALIILITYKHSNGDVEQTVVAHNPATVESFTLPITDDNNGILEYFVWPVYLFDDEAVYEEGDIVYDNTTSPASPTIEKYIDAEWVEISAEDLKAETIEGTLEDTAFPFPRATAFRNELNAEKIRTLKPVVRGESSDKEYITARNYFDYVDGELDLATKAFCAGAYNEAQLKLEAIFTLQDTIETANG